MEDPFTVVVVGAVALFAFIGFVSFLMGGGVYDKIGEGGLTMGDGMTRGPIGPDPNSPLGRAEREMEIRQMLQARSDRLVRNGGDALDIDAEMALLEQPPGGSVVGKHDAGLVEEVRQLVMARNERRMRSGEDPMDVDEEIKRTLAELDPDGG